MLVVLVMTFIVHPGIFDRSPPQFTPRRTWPPAKFPPNDFPEPLLTDRFEFDSILVSSRARATKNLNSFLTGSKAVARTTVTIAIYVVESSNTVFGPTRPVGPPDVLKFDLRLHTTAKPSPG